MKSPLLVQMYPDNKITTEYYQGVTLDKEQVAEIAKAEWIALDEPVCLGCEFNDRKFSVTGEMMRLSQKFRDFINGDESIYGADFLIVAYRPIKEDEDE